MSYSRQAANYRELEVLSASPDRLVTMLFEHLVVQLERSRIATEADDLPRQVEALTTARAIVGELLATLDFEQGGALADQLSSIYQFMLIELVDVGQRRDAAMLRRLSGIAAELRDGFVGAAEQLHAVRLSA